jgi:hypothetical protein
MLLAVYHSLVIFYGTVLVINDGDILPNGQVGGSICASVVYVLVFSPLREPTDWLISLAHRLLCSSLLLFLLNEGGWNASDGCILLGHRYHNR